MSIEGCLTQAHSRSYSVTKPPALIIRDVKVNCTALPSWPARRAGLLSYEADAHCRISIPVGGQCQWHAHFLGAKLG